jgi:hypothetical protein
LIPYYPALFFVTVSIVLEKCTTERRRSIMEKALFVSIIKENILEMVDISFRQGKFRNSLGLKRRFCPDSAWW